MMKLRKWVLQFEKFLINFKSEAKNNCSLEALGICQNISFSKVFFYSIPGWLWYELCHCLFAGHLYKHRRLRGDPSAWWFRLHNRHWLNIVTQKSAIHPVWSGLWKAAPAATSHVHLYDRHHCRHSYSWATFRWHFRWTTLENGNVVTCRLLWAKETDTFGLPSSPRRVLGCLACSCNFKMMQVKRIMNMMTMSLKSEDENYL